MICLTPEPRALSTPRGECLSPEKLQTILARLFPNRGRVDRRNDGRYPFPFLVEIEPVNGATLQPIGDSLVVVGKDLSEHGLGFFHQTPIPFRHAIVAIGAPGQTPVRMLIHLNWCRFTGRGWYENGGRFLRLLDEMTWAA